MRIEVSWRQAQRGSSREGQLAGAALVAPGVARLEPTWPCGRSSSAVVGVRVVTRLTSVELTRWTWIQSPPGPTSR